ncbi:MAG: ATP-binding protein, partial [Acidimicrobiales bacterium]|nr:ATP-binding protein [Acidimicrobiales bacterium]
FIVAVNVFDGAPQYHPEALRDALALTADVPLVMCDARRDGTVIPVLITLVEHALTRTLAGA